MSEKKVVKHILYNEKKDCSGCGACKNACPKSAISMVEDEYGFVYPRIDADKCIECGICRKTCGIQNHTVMREPEKVYALAEKDEEAIKRSASGGAFEVMARKILSEGGAVVGVALNESDGKLKPEHVIVTDVADLPRLQGSKYVQSDTGDIFKEIVKLAKNGKKVLFTGTPCQNASLRNFLGKEYSNIILVDIICHGVPNIRMFMDFIKYRSSNLKARVKEFYFRDNRFGQGYTTRMVYEKNGEYKEKICKGELFAYIRFFSKSLTLRDSCYSCPFATKKRVSDVTIGDFWGFNEELGNYKTYEMNDSRGISCVMVNTKKGADLLELVGNQVVKIETEYSKVLKHNKQLNSPTPKPVDRDYVLDIYIKYGYLGLEKLYWKKWPNDKIKYCLSSMISKIIKRKKDF